MPILPKSCTRNKPRAALGVFALAVLPILAAGLLLGSQTYSPALLWRSLWGGSQDPVYRILVYIRIPRVLGAFLAGSALALAGALLQSVLNNPMASPNIIGVNAGAGFFGLLAGVLLPELHAPAAFLGALLTALFIFALAKKAGLSRTTLILAGTAVNAILNAGVQAVNTLFPELSIGSGFLAGSLSGVTLSALANAGWYLAAGTLLALLLTGELNVLRLGEESASALGVSVGRVRFLTVLAAALLAGGAVSFAGLLGFVGLLVPHIARRFLGSDCRWLFPGCILLGGALVVLCDTLSRVLFSPFELPVGILLAALGGPFFLWLLLRRKGRRPL